MKIISSKLHAVLDYLFIAFVIASPTIFKMEGTLSTITYILGVVHFMLTIFTNFELGVIKIIPFKIHGLIEIFVAVVLTGSGLWFKSNNNTTGFYYYISLAIITLIVFILTDFKTQNKITT